MTVWKWLYGNCKCEIILCIAWRWLQYYGRSALKFLPHVNMWDMASLNYGDVPHLPLDDFNFLPL